jgi:hypothetical protein
MLVTVKHEIELSEWEVVTVGSMVEVIDNDYNGFVAVRHNGREFYLHSEYLNIPVLSVNY